MNSRTLILSALVVVLFVVGCGGGESATVTMRPTETPTKRLTELLNGSWRGIGWPPEIKPVVFDFDKGTIEHPYLSAPGGGNTHELTLIEETAEAVIFEARGYTWTVSFNEDGTIRLEAVGRIVDLERVE